MRSPDAANSSMRHHNEYWSQFEPFMLAALKRMPALAQAGIQHFMNGSESFTPDARLRAVRYVGR